jgi:hypothetical protein
MPVLLCAIGWLLLLSPIAVASHRGLEEHASSEVRDSEESIGRAIPGASFQVYWGKSKVSVEDGMLTESQVDETIQTVINAFSEMVAHRAQYKRFDEALTKRALQKVIIEPKVFNRDGKEFMFLVARTKHQGQVKLLINASALKEQGLVNYPEQLVPVLAREAPMGDQQSRYVEKNDRSLPLREIFSMLPFRQGKKLTTRRGTSVRKPWNRSLKAISPQLMNITV